MKTSDFHYHLPEHLIAQHPLLERDQSRLLVLDRKNGHLTHGVFRDILAYLLPGDCLVVNNTRVLPARLLGEKDGTGGRIEFLLLHRIMGDEWEVLVYPGKKAKPGSHFTFGNGRLHAEVLSILEGGNRHVRFTYDGIWEEVLDAVGLMPLPPYISASLEDRERYQTVYAKANGSAAAPTAGLHFTPQLMAELQAKGIQIAEVTLHVGLGTFRPVKVEDVSQHLMHAETYEITQATADIINETRQAGKKVIAVGTTSVRVLESVANESGILHASSGDTRIFITPGYRFKAVDALITNFHLPESTLLMLVSAFADKESVLAAYEKAIEQQYRFFSFGDAMLIL